LLHHVPQRDASRELKDHRIRYLGSDQHPEEAHPYLDGAIRASRLGCVGRGSGAAARSKERMVRDDGVPAHTHRPPPLPGEMGWKVGSAWHVQCIRIVNNISAMRLVSQTLEWLTSGRLRTGASLLRLFDQDQ